MRVIERPEIKGGNVSCVSCGKSTRSHRLENPEYEEYEELWEDEPEEYQARKKTKDEEELTEEEVVIRYRLMTEQVCMCHGCWTEKRNKATSFLNQNRDAWVKDAPTYMVRIKKFLSSWGYYGFSNDLDLGIQKDIIAVRTALKSGKGLGEEE